MANFENKIDNAVARICEYPITWHKTKRFVRKSFTFFLMFLTAMSWSYGLVPDAIKDYAPQPQKAQAATMSLRQEINILNSYLLGTTGAYATSSERISIATSTKLANATYYFEVVASTTGGTSFTAQLRNATSSVTHASITVSATTASTSRVAFSASPSSSVDADYVVVISNAATTKGINAARVVVLQTSGDITNTQTQIEIGSATSTASNTSTLQVHTNPNYWYYDSANWDGSPTVYAEVAYQNIQVSSSTIYIVPGTYTYVGSPGVSYAQVELWGSGGGGRCTTSTAGGGGGGGGAYARSTTTPTAGSSYTVVVAATTTCATTGADSTYATNVVVADGGAGTSSNTGALGGNTTNTIGQVEFAGGNGGAALGTNDTGGGGGGGAGRNGVGGGGSAGPSGATTSGGGGGGGNGGSTASNTATGGSSTNGGAGGNGGASANGSTGVSSTEGGGGGGGSGSTALRGGAGGSPGGGGGGGDNTNTSPLSYGARGQARILETHGKVKFAIEEDDGAFGSWTFKTMVGTNTGVVSTSTVARIRSDSFTPTSGRHYRLVASTTNASATYSVYNAKIIVDQTSPTKLEPQYLIATNHNFAGSTGLKDKDTYFNPAEWSGVNNTYYHEASGVSAGTADIKLQSDPNGTPADVTNSAITDVVQRERSSALTMPGSATYIDTNVTGTGSISSSRIIVVVGPATSIGGTVYGSEGGSNIGSGVTVNLYKNGSTLLGTDTTDGSGVYSITGAPSSGDILTAYVDGHATNGVTVFVSDGTTKSDVHIYGGTLAVRDDVGSGITNANLHTGAIYGEADMNFSTSTSNAITVDTNTELHVWTGDTYTPGGSVTTQGTGDLHLDDTSTVTLGSGTVTIADDINVDNASTLNINTNTSVGGDIVTAGTASVTTTSGTPTVTLTGTGTLGGGTNALTFYNLTGSGAGTITANSTTTITNNMTAGSKTWNYIPVYQPISVGGTFSADTSTFSFQGATAFTIPDLDYYNLDLSPSSGSPTYTPYYTAASGVTFSDDFNRANSTNLGANWNELDAGLSISSNTLLGTVSEASIALYTGDQVDTINQYMRFTLTTMPASGEFQPAFRYTDANTQFYSINFNGNADTAYWNGNSTYAEYASAAGTTIQSQAITIGSGDVFGVTINGTGNDTVVRIWKNPTGNAPDSASSWGGDTSPDVTFTDDPGAEVADSGYSVMVGGYMAYQVDDFYAGDIVVTPLSNSLVATNNLSLGGAGNVTLDLNTNDPTVTIGGSLTIGSSDVVSASNSGNLSIGASFTNNGTFTHNSGTMTLAGTGSISSSGVSDTLAFYNLVGSGAGTITANSTTTVANNFTAGSKTWNFTTSYEPLIIGGTLIPDISTISFQGSGNATVTNATYYNLDISPSSGSPTIKFATTTGKTLTVNNNLTIGGTGNATVDVNTRDPDLSIGGSLTIGSGDTLSASNSGTLSIGTNFTNNGTFTNNSGTVTLNTANTTAITSSANMTFYNMTVATPGKTLRFEAHSGDEIPTFSFDGQLTVTGSAGSYIDIGSNSVGNQWLADFNIAQTSITYVNVSDSACVVGSLSVTYSATNSGGGNNGTCWNIANKGADGTNQVSSTEQGSGGGTLRVGGGSGGGGGGSGGDGGSGGGQGQTGGGQGGGGGGGSP